MSAPRSKRTFSPVSLSASCQRQMFLCSTITIQPTYYCTMYIVTLLNGSLKEKGGFNVYQ